MSETTGFFTPSQANIEQLRIILEQRSSTVVSFEEAEEVAIQLVSFYECLARDRTPTKEQCNGSLT